MAPACNPRGESSFRVSTPYESLAILERFQLAHGKNIDLSLRPSYANLLAKLGHPEKNLPPVIHVAGTNGKGSTCAFLRALIEAAGLKAHIYTSPHLVSFHERIRIAGDLIGEDELVSLLHEIETLAEPGAVSIFEIATAAALTAFARHKADVTILEVGLGGRLDATNVVPTPAATVISRLSFDHREYLGTTMTEIAREKAGILRQGVPCLVAPQPSFEAMACLRQQAKEARAPLLVGGIDWRIEETAGQTFRFVSEPRTLEDLPLPALVGAHQLWNAGLAIASLQALPYTIPDKAIRTAMHTVAWKGRLHRLTEGKLFDLVPQGGELWLDGGHNDSAGEVLAAQAEQWKKQDSRPLDLVYGMLATKSPEEFLTPLLPHIRRMRTIAVSTEMPCFSAPELADRARALGVKEARPSTQLAEAVQSMADPQARLLVCGSLYLVGDALRANAKA